MKKRVRTVSSMLALCALGICASCARPEPPTLTRVLVTADADAKVQPDTAVVVLSVVTQHRLALEAQRENARKSEAVITAVRAAAGSDATEVKTSDYKLEPQQTYRDDRMPSIIGYEARNTVTVTTGELNNVGAIIDAASQAGANSVETVAFVLRESNPARSQTLAEATRLAMMKAQAIAQALGGRVVRVVEQQEGGVEYRPPIGERQANASANTSTAGSTYMSQRTPGTPVEAGSLNVKSQVQLIVEVEVRPSAEGR